MAGTQAAANALTNLARAAVGLGFAGSALNASMYNGTWHPEKKGEGKRRLVTMRKPSGEERVEGMRARVQRSPSAYMVWCV